MCAAIGLSIVVVGTCVACMAPRASRRTATLDLVAGGLVIAGLAIIGLQIGGLFPRL